MIPGLQAGFRASIAPDLPLIRTLRFRMVRTDVQGVADPAPLVHELVEYQFRPLVLATPDQVTSLPAEIDIELYNEPDINGPSPTAYATQVAGVIAAARASGQHLWCGAVSNLNARGFAYLAALVPQLPPDVGISVHRYPEPSAPYAGHDGRTRDGEVARLRGLVGSRPWGVSEFGYHSAFERGLTSPLSDEEVARCVIYEWEFWAAAGADFAVLYQLNDGPTTTALDRYGIRRLDGTLKPVAGTVPKENHI